MKYHRLILLLLGVTTFACTRQKAQKYTATTQEFAFTVMEKEFGAPDFHNLTLEVSRIDQTDLVSALSKLYSEADAINYLSFRLQKDIKLKSGIDTIDVIGYHFERSFDLRKSRIINLTFEYQGRSFNETDALIINSPLFDKQVLIPLVES